MLESRKHYQFLLGFLGVHIVDERLKGGSQCEKKVKTLSILKNTQYRARASTWSVLDIFG